MLSKIPNNILFIEHGFYVGCFMQSELFRAFERTRLLIGDKKEVHYSRCGRTDRGVSAVGQVSAKIAISCFRTYII